MCSVSVFVRLKPGGDSVRKLDSATVGFFDGTDQYIFRPHGGGVIDTFEDMQVVMDRVVGSVLIMGFGHSGSGKTHSIFGPGGAIESFLAKRLNLPSTCSFVEVYNERVYDLLGSPGVALSVLEERGKVSVRNLTSVKVGSADEIFALVDIGMRARVFGQNGVHARSSRSHAIFQIGPVSFVDLAGSERIVVKKSIENTAIHKSLHALHRCLLALRQGSKHMPVRSSVLTRILFSTHRNLDACILVACVETDANSLSETLSTIDFAGMVAGITRWETKPQSFPKSLPQPVPTQSSTPQLSPSSETSSSVLSATWRQNRFEEILDRCWRT